MQALWNMEINSVAEYLQFRHKALISSFATKPSKAV